GRLAADHLIECGLRSFAYLGLKDIWYSELRREGFAERVAEAGGTVDAYEMPRYRDPNKAWQSGLEQIGRCLEQIRPPTGVFAVNDYRARLLVDECHRRKLIVPDEVAIIGVDNDDVVCEFCTPPLSSVSRSGYQVGHETAVLLDRLMAGGMPPAQEVLIPPDGVVKRRSTDLIAVEHPQVAAAMEYIRGHLNEWFGVERLVKVLPISRRQLELLFKKHLNQTPYDYLRRARLDRAKTLLSAPRRTPVAEIARQCGFPNTHRFLMVFRDVEGKTPTNYRRDLRGLW
ncbi:MAG TPA: hypothetical protein DD670_21135, partial [Planctomycetaceae bacterium]|nr:hypothetical protein [Planctomycetaceae bacterium]